MSQEEELLRLISDVPAPEVSALLGEVPGRWGRMPLLSRLLIVEAGRALQKAKIMKCGERLCDLGYNVGMIGVTSRGSLYTDQAFRGTMDGGLGLASPALFGYTLPNIPLAEAAVVFGLTGPVYALFEESEDKFKLAKDEAVRLLTMQQRLDYMLACEFDHYLLEERQEKLSVTINVIK